MSEDKSTTTEPTGLPTPDIDRVDASDWPERAFPIDDGRSEHSVRVVIKQSVLNDIHQHGQSTTEVEICGVLVGHGYRTDHGAFIYVEANIRGQHSDSKAAQVTFTGETWNHIHNELDALNAGREEPNDLQILGWYHTHPGFGIFLSGMDLFIHENYFSGEQQLALVYDPIGGDEGLFVWRNGKATRDGFLVEPDVKEDPPPVAAGPPSEPMTAAADIPEQPQQTADDSNVQERLQRIEKRLTFNDLGVFAAVALAIVVPLLMWLLWIEPRLRPAHSPTREEQPTAGSPTRPETGQSDNPVSSAEDDDTGDSADGAAASDAAEPNDEDSDDDAPESADGGHAQPSELPDDNTPEDDVPTEANDGNVTDGEPTDGKATEDVENELKDAPEENPSV